MDLGLNRKVALVCAASQGLGFAVADELAAEGARVAICSRRQESIDKAADAIRTRSGGEILAIAGDVSVSADIERIVASTIEAFGGIDILVTNSGGPPAGNFDQLTDASWEEAMQIDKRLTRQRRAWCLSRQCQPEEQRLRDVRHAASTADLSLLPTSSFLRPQFPPREAGGTIPFRR